MKFGHGARSAVLVGLALALGPHPAAAQPPTLALILSCEGSDTTVQQTGVATTTTVTPGIRPAIGSEAHKNFVEAQTRSTTTTAHPIVSEVRVSARLSVIVDGQAVRVKPPSTSLPTFGKKPADGWYPLTEVSITDDEISGKAPFGGMLSGKYRLRIDRRTGDAKFGDFRGACEKVADDPNARRF